MAASGRASRLVVIKSCDAKLREVWYTLSNASAGGASKRLWRWPTAVATGRGIVPARANQEVGLESL